MVCTLPGGDGGGVPVGCRASTQVLQVSAESRCVNAVGHEGNTNLPTQGYTKEGQPCVCTSTSEERTPHRRGAPSTSPARAWHSHWPGNATKHMHKHSTWTINTFNIPSISTDKRPSSCRAVMQAAGGTGPPSSTTRAARIKGREAEGPHQDPATPAFVCVPPS